MPWRRAWQPSPVFLPGESHGQRSLAGYSPWRHKESDTTEAMWQMCAHQMAARLRNRERALEARWSLQGNESVNILFKNIRGNVTLPPQYLSAKN